MIAQVTVRFLPAIEVNCVLESKHLKKRREAAQQTAFAWWGTVKLLEGMSNEM